MKYLSNKVYFYRETTPELVQFFFQNSGSESIFFTLIVDNSLGGLNIDDKQIVAKLWLGPNTQRTTILEVRPNDPAIAWSFSYTCEAKIGTIMDYLEVCFSLKFKCLKTSFLICYFLHQTKDNMIENTLNGYKSWLNPDAVAGMDEAAVLQLCQSHHTHFIDPAFPPTKQSLYLDMEDHSLVKEKDILPIQWKRPREFFKSGVKPSVFNAGVMAPSDILQGRHEEVLHQKKKTNPNLIRLF